jgi:hypothetical protein
MYKLTRYTGYFTSDNEPGGIENATHNTLPMPPIILFVTTVTNVFEQGENRHDPDLWRM